MKAKHRMPRSTFLLPAAGSAKKWLTLLLAMALLKIFCTAAYVRRWPEAGLQSLMARDVSAQEKNSEGDKAADKTGTDNETRSYSRENGQADSLEWSYDLIKEIKEREETVRLREDALKNEEARLAGIRRDIEIKMEDLGRIEKKVAELIEQKKAVENEKLFKLAKVFEATPPEQAGPLLSELDVDIAAQLLLKMQGRKAGRIWGFVDPNKAVKISEEISRLKPGLDISKIGKQ